MSLQYKAVILSNSTAEKPDEGFYLCSQVGKSMRGLPISKKAHAREALYLSCHKSSSLKFRGQNLAKNVFEVSRLANNVKKGTTMFLEDEEFGAVDANGIDNNAHSLVLAITKLFLKLRRPFLN